MKRVLWLLLAVYASVPVVLYLCPWILAHMVFCHLLRFPLLVDLSRPELLLKHTRNLYLATEEGVSVGVWHTLPASQWEEAAGKSPEWHQETLGDGAPVVIYLHGNVGSRALSHRVQLVKMLSAAGCHVLSLDYRGFGDSTGEPSEAGLTSDALHLYKWVKHGAGAGAGPLLLWGHSLGSGVATNAAVQLQRQGVAIDALILEAPYTKIGEVVVQHRLSQLYMFLPGFEQLLWSILEKNNIKFANDENLKLLSCPLLILHSEDDAVVPHHMGLKLHQIAVEAKEARNSGVPVQMVSYGSGLGLSHSNIYKDPQLASVVRTFLQNLR
ncbi:lysophosphatidylserine lipase ABHD12-like [Synchiropus splendidus]|uniref:lysophosphatidylserine lipase ABHD12-like n=1 Tax=Synchiropus splendidus TaxID=270530 RepID=UPI00237DC5A5|nr:lysophosphatidylserine lipase ABHD12-like [Synchiropus splendidus]XP_053700921.1 lysophosphatidylserine lipase ABHD12-like [Synchiropus splendidus]XP_053700922.1 lysophosphatidylserine lipase ABHD12-like [Synchiropus splendidus]XP_053700923.1 lysophosphatidylserine lipase ABHD12-like [Synchiropus splendidus]XP_053700924.1 lysophosphatidylserine lipase ABHD12-like [Synchiropus splendidus]